MKCKKTFTTEYALGFRALKSTEMEKTRHKDEFNQNSNKLTMKLIA